MEAVRSTFFEFANICGTVCTLMSCLDKISQSKLILYWIKSDPEPRWRFSELLFSLFSFGCRRQLAGRKTALSSSSVISSSAPLSRGSLARWDAAPWACTRHAHHHNTASIAHHPSQCCTAGHGSYKVDLVSLSLLLLLISDILLQAWSIPPVNTSSCGSSPWRTWRWWRVRLHLQILQMFFFSHMVLVTAFNL